MGVRESTTSKKAVNEKFVYGIQISTNKDIKNVGKLYTIAINPQNCRHSTN